MSKELGLKIKKARTWKGITQKELAEKLGTTQERISAIENGANINIKTLDKILGVLNAEIIIKNIDNI